MFFKLKLIYRQGRHLSPIWHKGSSTWCWQLLQLNHLSLRTWWTNIARSIQSHNFTCKCKTKTQLHYWWTHLRSIHKCIPRTLQGDPNHLRQTYVDGARAQYQLADKPRPLCSVQSPGWSPDDKVCSPPKWYASSRRASLRPNEPRSWWKKNNFSDHIFLSRGWRDFLGMRFSQTHRPPNGREMFKRSGLLPWMKPMRNAVLIAEVVNGQGRTFSLSLGTSYRRF